MSEFDQNTQGENTQNNNGEQASSVYSYSYSDINQGENATADQQNRQTYLVTDESEKARIIAFEQQLSKGVTIDADGYVEKLY